MKLAVYEGKNAETILNEALNELGVDKEHVIYSIKEEKGSLFKATIYKLKIAKIEDVAEYLKEYLHELTKNMNLEVSFEVRIREEQISIKMYSDNNSILIGRGGKTLTAIQTILRQLVFNEFEKYPYIILDVENYKEKRNATIEHLAKRLAKDVIRTKVDVKMENMNSYERRLVHNALSEFKNISTTSEGEEPNRHVVISYKES